MRYLLPLFLLLICTQLRAQIDTEFWFGAPDLTKGTGFEARRDSTIYLVFSSFDQPSEVRISQPANPDFDPIVVNLAANTTQRQNLGVFLSLIETKPANTVLNTGLLIRSSKPITCYYEVGGNNNTDIWSLKGKNSLGSRFYTPFQTEFQNNQTLNGSDAYIPAPTSGFIVMATQNNTSVFITPSIDILGHNAGDAFEVLLDRGQTYYCESVGGAPEDKPGGSFIESDKPITVTVKDDMVDVDPITSLGGADVIGDQLISEDYLGTEHIVVKGDVDNNAERVIICGTIDGTELFINGSTDAIIINAGEQYIHQVINDAVFLESSQRVAVLQVTGRSDQIAGAVVPSLGCTGSNRVGFIRGGAQPFFLNLTTRAGSEGDFELDGDPALIPASAFAIVPGTGGEYVYARIQYGTGTLPVNSAHVVTNDSDELFHLATMNGNSASANFGYFSAFSYLNIGRSFEVCLEDTIVLDAGPGKTSYAWSTGDTTQAITVTEPGQYYVDVMSGSDCSASDTTTVSYYEPPVDLGLNDTICDGTSLTLQVEGAFNFTWQDGTEEDNITVSEPGIYWVEVTDFQECVLRDSITISVSPRPATPTIVGEDTYCAGETIQLAMANVVGANYRYINPAGELIGGQNFSLENAQLSDAGRYYAFYILDGCETFQDSIDITIQESPIVNLGEDIAVCEDVPVLLEPAPVIGDFQWQDGSTGDTFVPTLTGTYYLDVTNSIGCVGSDTVQVALSPFPANPIISGETAYCEGESVSLMVPEQEGANYSWEDSDGNVVSENAILSITEAPLAAAGLYEVTVELGGCFSDPAAETIVVNANPEFDLGSNPLVCDDATAVLTGPAGFAGYEWSTGSFSQSIDAVMGDYTLTVTDANGCQATDAISVSQKAPTAAFTVFPDTLVTPTTIVAFIDASDGNGNPITSWFWEFGNGDTSNEQNPSYQYSDAGVYIVTLVVSDADGCSSKASIHIISQLDFKIPEGFSPNGDGINDTFEIRGLQSMPGTAVQIFNRWGAAVFESNNYNPNNFWDAEDHTDGTYFYIVKLPDGTTINGNVTVAR